MKIPRNFLYFLTLHESCAERLVAKAQCLTPKEVEVLPDPDVAAIRKMVSAVLGELHRMRGFVRLSPLCNCILYGYMKPRHRIGMDVCDYFARRNPYTLILLGHGLKSWASLDNGGQILHFEGGSLEEALRQVEAALEDCRDNADDTKIDKIWKIYYSSQLCPERRNLDAFHRRMPRAVLRSVGTGVEQNRNGVTLKDFFKDI